MISARKTALSALCRIENDCAYSNIVLGATLKKGGLSQHDKAFVTNLVYGVLDRRITLDYYINKLSDIPVKKLDMTVKNILRLGIYQIAYLERVPNSAAVNESVNLAKENANRESVSFVNAVLRSASQKLPQLPSGNSLYDISVKYSCPVGIVSAFIKDYGVDETKRILSEFLKPSPVCIRVNSLKTTVTEFENYLTANNINYIKGNTDLSYVLNGGVDFYGDIAFKNGLFYVQDTASQLCAAAVAPKPGQRLLDVCASPGGKSFTMAMLMQNNGEIVSCDLKGRVGLIADGAKRLGIDIIKATENDATVYNSELGFFDAVLCDVPCSGMGVLRRKPEIKYKALNGYSDITVIQQNILKTSAGYLKKGGRLVYSTCTLLKAENEQQVEAFLKENTDFRLEYMNTDLPGEFNDGFFHAVLVKK